MGSGIFAVKSKYQAKLLLTNQKIGKVSKSRVNGAQSKILRMEIK